MFSLQDVVRNTLHKPPFIVIHGGAGVGKTSFAATAPNAIFIPVEDGLGVLDVATFPEPKKAEEISMMMNTLLTQQHSYQWLVVDSMTAMEKKIWTDLCSKSNSNSIEDVGGGYGKGFTQTLEWVNKFINDLRYLREVKGMGIILIAHTKIKTINPPDKASYDTYMLNVHDKIADFIHTQADIVAYCELEALVRTKEMGFGHEQGTIKETGNRLMHCYSSNRYTSKNRYKITQPLPMDFMVLMQEIGKSVPQSVSTITTTTEAQNNG
jgi:hypothetical protein